MPILPGYKENANRAQFGQSGAGYQNYQTKFPRDPGGLTGWAAGGGNAGYANNAGGNARLGQSNGRPNVQDFASTSRFRREYNEGPGEVRRTTAAAAPAPAPLNNVALQPPTRAAAPRAAAAGAVFGAGSAVMRTPRGSAQSEQRAAMLGNAGMPQLAASTPYQGGGNLFQGMGPDAQRVMRSSFAGNEPALAESTVQSSTGFPAFSSNGQQAAMASFGGNNPQAAQTGSKAPTRYDTTGLDDNMAQWVRANENGPVSVQDGKTVVDRFMEKRARANQGVSPFGAQNTPEAQELMTGAFKTGSPDFTSSGIGMPAESAIDPSMVTAAYQGRGSDLSPAGAMAPRGAAFGREVGGISPFNGAPDVLSRSVGDPMVQEANFGQAFRADSMGDAPGNVPDPGDEFRKRLGAFNGVDPAVSFAPDSAQMGPALRGNDPLMREANFGQASRMDLLAGAPFQGNSDLYTQAFNAAVERPAWAAFRR